MYLKLEASNGKLPDFMSWSGQNVLPWFWKPFAYAPVAIILSVLVPAVLALIIGYLTFKNRIKGVYFSILTQALSIIFVVLFVGQQAYTGGTNGITNFKTIFGFPLSGFSTKVTLYYVALGFLILAFLFCRWIVQSRLGKVLIAIRDSENRARFSGYNPAIYKTFVYCISAGLAGLAGALFVPQVGIISPAEMGIVPSVEMVIWVAIGGRGTLVGSVIGAILVNSLKSMVSESFPAVWSYFIGMDLELEVKDRYEGIVEIVFRYYDIEFNVHFSLENDRLFKSEDSLARSIFIKRQYSDISLLDYLNANPLVLYFSDFSSLIGHEYYRKNYDDLILIGEDALEPIEWEENGVDIQCEFGEASDGKISIHDF